VEEKKKKRKKEERERESLSQVNDLFTVDIKPEFKGTFRNFLNENTLCIFF
jgi:hypothetical protein